MDKANPTPLSDQARRAAISPSWDSVMGGGGIVLAICIPAAIVAYVLMKHDAFDTRMKVSEAIAAANDTRESVTAFHAREKRLPSPQEATGLPSRAAGTWAQFITWDAAGKRIVITLATPMAGKQLALHAQAREGSIEWTCRNIDIPSEYVPPTCRNQTP